MSLFRRKKQKPQQQPVSPSTTPQHAVICHYAVSPSDLGTDGQLESLFALEDRLIEVIKSTAVGEFDGNEVGQGEAVIYAYGPDADRLFGAMEEHLRAFPARPAFCILRYGDASDPNAVERRVHL